MNIEFKGRKTAYQLTHDKRQYVLSEKRKVVEGKTQGEYVYTPIGFYSKINKVFEKVLDLEIYDADAHSFAELFAAITDAREFINTIISEKTKTA